MFTRFLMIVSTMVFASVASAESYFTVTGGGNFSTTFEGDGKNVSFVAEPDLGYAASAALGVHVAALPGARVELEASWRHSSLGGELNVCKNTDPISGSDGTFAAMVNVAYDYPVAGFKPYVLAGAGYGTRRIVLEPTPDNWAINSTGTERAGFVWQVGAGVEYPVSKDVSVGIGYRYVVAPHIDRIAIFNGKSSFFEASGDNHAVVATLTVALD